MLQHNGGSSSVKACKKANVALGPKAKMTVSLLLEQLVDAYGCCGLTAWASADARDSNMIHKKSRVPLYLAEASLPDFQGPRFRSSTAGSDTR